MPDDLPEAPAPANIPPIPDPTPAPAAVSAPPSVSVPTPAPEAVPGAKRILIVDDDPLLMRMYERKLVKEGFAVLLAKNGREALAVLATETPDLMLIDVLMPEMNGWETLKHIKADARLAAIPAITLTSLDDRSEDIAKFKELGVKAYISKSQVSLADLVATVRTHLA